MPDMADPSTSASGAGGQPSSGDATPLSSRSTFSVEGNPTMKLDKQEVESYMQSKQTMQQVQSTSNLAGMRHVASSDVLLDMQNIELHPIAKPEKPPDGRKCGAKVKDFIVEDYYVPRGEILRQIISGVLAALAVVPESIAFALVVGVQPQVGIDTTFVTSIIIGIVGARPGLVNGASGAIAVVIVTIVQQYGERYMGYTVILAGIFIIIFSLLRLSVLVCLISAPVMVGFVNGLGIIMCLAQVGNFKLNQLGDYEEPMTPVPVMDNSTDVPMRHLLANYDVFFDGEPWVSPQVAGWMFLEIIIVMASMVLFPMIPWKWTKNIPGSLVGIFLATAAEWAIVRPAGFATQTIGDIGRMDGAFPVPLWMRDYDLPPINMETFGIILPTAIALAMVALIEQLMTVEVVNEMTKSRCNSGREAFGLGVANVVAGLLGGMGGNAMIAHSMLQVAAGGKYRIANIIVGLMVIIISVAAFPFVNLIPSAAFVGMIWLMVYHMIAWRSFMVMFHSCLSLRQREKRDMHNKIKRSDALIIVIVTVVTVFTNLAVAVGCGVLVNVVVYVLDSKRSLTLDTKADIEAIDPKDRTSHVTRMYEISGPLFFASARQFVAFFTIEDDPNEVEVHCQQLQIMDYSALDAIAKVAGEYKAAGKQFHLRYLEEQSHRTLAKGRHMLRDVTTWRVDKLPDDGLIVDGALPEDVTNLRKNQFEFHVTMEETWMAKQARANAAGRSNATSVRGRKKSPPQEAGNSDNAAASEANNTRTQSRLSTINSGTLPDPITPGEN